MKIMTITLLSLPLVLFGFHQVQGKGMVQKSDATAMSQSMESDGMKMKSDDLKMDSAKDETMAPQASYRVPTDEELKRRLTPLQYAVTRNDDTERAFDNAYWNNHADGIYVDMISGVPLFSSTDKYESGTGWPSFTRPLAPDNIVEIEDRSLFSVRTEVRSKLADSHLGHVFDDGPAPTDLRYCMNSAALRFISQADLEKEGYGEYLKLFK